MTSTNYRVLIAAVLLLGTVLLGRLGWQHAYQQGEAAGQEQVRQQWAADTTQRNALALQEWQRAQTAVRAQEAAWRQENERLTHEFTQRETALRAAVAAAGTEQQRLRSTIAQLNAAAARAADLPTAPATQPAPSADAATTARELLGQCSGEYAAVAAAADALSAQVLGLQGWVRMVGFDFAQPTGVSNGF
ncbi:MAG: DUF2514 family protein [Comamonas sp.]|nr:DUF2514 family protein [Comamonas sp.]